MWCKAQQVCIAVEQDGPIVSGIEETQIADMAELGCSQRTTAKKKRYVKAHKSSHATPLAV